MNAYMISSRINFMKPDAPINKESAVYQMVHDEEQQRAKGRTSHFL